MRYKLASCVHVTVQWAEGHYNVRAALGLSGHYID